MAVFRSRGVESPSVELDVSAELAAMRAEMVEVATRHEILAAQRTDLVVDQLWRRLEAADARLASVLQRLEDRVEALERGPANVDLLDGPHHPAG